MRADTWFAASGASQHIADDTGARRAEPEARKAFGASVEVGTIEATCRAGGAFFFVRTVEASSEAAVAADVVAIVSESGAE